MKIKQFRYAADNFSYLLHGDRTALAIDAGAVESILAYVSEADLDLQYVTNTHMHPDHTTGNRDILGRSNAEFLDNQTLRRQQAIRLDGEEIRIYQTPGHTEDSLTFHIDRCIISGDTLFNGTVGNCFTGDLEAFFSSIKLIFDLPESTTVYAGHDYVRYAVQFARTIDPDNPELDRFLEKYDPYHVYSTLADELKVNPYVRFNDEKMIAILQQKGLPVDTEFQRWKSLMEIY